MQKESRSLRSGALKSLEGISPKAFLFAAAQTVSIRHHTRSVVISGICRRLFTFLFYFYLL